MIRYSQYWGRSPDQLGRDHILGFLLSLHEGGLADSTINQAVNAIRYFYRNILARPMEEVKDDAPRTKQAKKLMRAYSVDQITALLEAAKPNPLAHGFLSTLYHTGMRLHEGCRLRFEEIERSNDRIVVREGKGKKDRFTLLPERLEHDLDCYYRKYRRKYGKTLRWVFVGKRAFHKPLSDGSAQEMFYRYRDRAGLPDVGGIHTLRNVFSYCYICLRTLYLKGNSACKSSSRMSWRPSLTANMAFLTTESESELRLMTHGAVATS